MLQTFPLKNATDVSIEKCYGHFHEMCYRRFHWKMLHTLWIRNILTDYHGCSVTIMIAFHGENPNFLRLITKNALYKSNFHTY